MPDETYPSIDDRRAEVPAGMDDNAVRKTYRALNEQEKLWMNMIKDNGQTLIDLINAIGHDTCTSGTSRELSIAKTKTEEAVMWAVKHITR